MTNLIARFLALCLLCQTLVSARAADHYVIDPAHTYSSFEYSHWGLSVQRGRFDQNTGYVDFDQDNKTGKVVLNIDANTVNMGSEEFNQVLRSEAFFDVLHFSTINFNSSKFIFDQEHLSQIEGALTIKDVTRPVTLEITQFNCRFMFLYLKTACGANGVARILRSDFNLDKYAPFVGDELTLYFSVEGIRE
ncbi:polyisoprenoid-binding protein YceI [Oxalobacteraceae bacterium GrIS 1.18]